MSKLTPKRILELAESEAALAANVAYHDYGRSAVYCDELYERVKASVLARYMADEGTVAQVAKAADELTVQEHDDLFAAQQDTYAGLLEMTR